MHSIHMGVVLNIPFVIKNLLIYGGLQNSVHSVVAIGLIMRRVTRTVYPKKYAHGFVVLCFVVVM